MINKKTLTVLILISMVISAEAAFKRADRGTAGAKFLKVGLGARAIGMGEAYVALADEASAAYWNPAGLTRIERPEIMAMRNMYLSGITNDALICAVPLQRYGQTIAISVKSLSMDAIDIYEGGELVKEFQPRDTMVGISYARVSGIMRYGVSVKGIRQEFLDARLSGYGIDAGMMVRDAMDRSGFGMSVLNVGPDIDGDKMPMMIKVGGMHRFLGSRNLTMSIEGNMPIDDEPSVHMGAEYKVRVVDGLKSAFRAGYKSKNVSELGILSGMSAGLGFEWEGVRVDYVFVPYGDLGNTHRVSLGYAFDGGKRYIAEKDYQEGRRLYEEGKLLDASKRLNEYTDKPSLHAQAARLGRIVEQEIHETMDPENMYTVAYLFYQDKKIRQARALLAEALKVEPEHLKARNLLVDVQKDLKQVTAKKEQKKERKDRIERSKKIKRLLKKGREYYEESEYEKSIDVYQDVLIYDSKNKTAKKMIRDMNRKMDKEKKDIEAKKEIIKEKMTRLNKEKAEALYQKGLKAYLEGRTDEAMGLWKKSIEHDPGHLQAKNALMRAQKL